METHADRGAPAMTEPGTLPELSTREQAELHDAVMFLELLLSECSGGSSDHAWRRCRRCLAFAALEGHQPLARAFVKTALAALRKVQP
jgi:hypothetical protein